MLDSTHTLVSPTPTTLEGYLLEFESSMSVSFVSEYSRKSVTGFVLVVHGFERPKHEEMKHLAVNRSVFTFHRAQVFQIHAPLALIR